MIRIALLAGLWACAAVPALAVDPADVAAVEPFLRDDEKAFLAAVLVDPAASAEFGADVKFAAGDPKITKLALDKWRGRVVAFAEGDLKLPTPNLEGTYKNYGALMTPPTRAYLLRRLKTMSEPERNSLIGYLDSVDTALAENSGHLTWYTKKVVNGIFDRYRQDLSTYLPVPLAKSGKAAAPAAALALAELRRAAEKPPVAAAPAKPAPPAIAARPPAGAPVKPAATGKPGASSALEQARQAAEAAARGGLTFDGGGAVPPAGAGPVAAGGASAGAPPLAPPPHAAGPGPLTAVVPSPADSEDEFMSSVKEMRTGPAPRRLAGRLFGFLGAILGAVAGFVVGGPAGAIVGAAFGYKGGDAAGAKLLK